MGEINNCGPTIQFNGESGVSVTDAGSGTSTDPRIVTSSADISATANNAIIVQPDGSLYVNAISTGSPIQGAVTTAGAIYPIDGNQRIIASIAYDDGTIAPFNTGTGRWTIQKATYPASSAWPLTCNVSDGKLVYRDDGNNHRLYTEPDKGVLSQTTATANNNYSGTVYASGNIYNEIGVSVTNSDTCGRSALMTVAYSWGGYDVSLVSNDLLFMNQQIRNPSTSAWSTEYLTRTQQVGPANPATLTATFGQISVVKHYIVAPGATVNPGLRIQVQSTAGSPSVGTATTNAPVRSNQLAVVMHILD